MEKKRQKIGSKGIKQGRENKEENHYLVSAHTWLWPSRGEEICSYHFGVDCHLAAVLAATCQQPSGGEAFALCRLVSTAMNTPIF